jgi:hypothetical protein
VVNEWGPRMSNEEYFDYMERAAGASSAGEVAAIRRDILQRYRGDPRADAFCDALSEHQRRFELSASRAGPERPAREGRTAGRPRR